MVFAHVIYFIPLQSYTIELRQEKKYKTWLNIIPIDKKEEYLVSWCRQSVFHKYWRVGTFNLFVTFGWFYLDIIWLIAIYLYIYNHKSW